MVLKIYNPQDNGFLQKIDWNFEDLKTEITESAQEYETSDRSIRMTRSRLPKQTGRN